MGQRPGVRLSWDTCPLIDSGPGSVNPSAWKCSRSPTGVSSDPSQSVTGHSATSLWPHGGPQPQRREGAAKSEEGGRGRRQSRRGTVGVAVSREEPHRPCSDTRTPGARQRHCRRWARTCLIPSINPTRKRAHTHFRAERTKLGEEICPRSFSWSSVELPAPEFTFASFSAAQPLPRLVPSPRVESTIMALHTHDPAPPHQAGPCLLQGCTWPGFRPQICSGKACLTAGITGASQRDRAQPPSSEEARAEQMASERQGLGVPRVEEVTSLRRDLGARKDQESETPAFES